MQYRRFGKTEMNLSVFTLGLMRYMSDDPDQSARVVQRAVELGINHLETARGYGNSEDLLGHALKTIDRSKVYITTKVTPRKTYGEFMRTFDTSMAKIGIDVLDNLDLHGINNEQKFKWAVNEKGTWRAVRKLMNSGTVKHIGYSCSRRSTRRCSSPSTCTITGSTRCMSRYCRGRRSWIWACSSSVRTKRAACCSSRRRRFASCPSPSIP